MSQNLMQQLARYEGYCCVYKYIKSFDGLFATDVAFRLGVAPITIRKWRRRIARGKVTCGHGATGCKGCIYNNPANKPPQNTP